MTRDSVLTFLAMLGARNIQASDEWVNCSCPLARWLHERYSDEKPSFGISVNDDGPSSYKCFSCSPSPKSVEHLLYIIKVLDGGEPNGLIRYYYLNETIGKTKNAISLDVWEVPQKPKRTTIGKKVLSLSVVDRAYPLVNTVSPGVFDKDILKYFLWRGIDRGVVGRCGVRSDIFNNALVFPLTNHNGDIQVLSIRLFPEKSCWYATAGEFHMKAEDMPRLKNEGPWFGLHQIDWSKPVVLVEGEIDRMRLMQLGLSNVIASSSTSVTWAQLANLRASGYVIAFDNDKAGIRAIHRLIKMFDDQSVLQIVNWRLINVKDAGEVRKRKHLRYVMQRLLSPDQFCDKHDLI